MSESIENGNLPDHPTSCRTPLSLFRLGERTQDQKKRHRRHDDARGISSAIAFEPSPSGRLPLCMPRGEREMPSDYLSRLSFLHGRDGLNLICGDFGIGFEALCKGNLNAIQAVAELAGCDPDDLLADAFVALPNNRWRWRTETLLSGDITKDIIRVCPACLRNDITLGRLRAEARPYRRGEWCLRSVRTCPAHDIALIVIKRRMGRYRNDTSRTLSGVVTCLDALERSAVRRKATEYESYLIERVASGRTDSWLDTMPLYAIVRAVTAVGMAEIHGFASLQTKLSDEQQAECDNAGFRILRDGQFGLARLVTRLLDRQEREMRDGRVPALLGPIHSWLRHNNGDAAYHGIRTALRDACTSVLPLGPGEKVAGILVEKRLVHSVYTAHKDSGVPLERLHRLLFATGIVDVPLGAAPPDSVRFDAAQAEPLLREIGNTLSLQDAAAYLGIPRRSKRLILECGIEPWIHAGSGGIKEHVFRKCELDGFLASLAEHARHEFTDAPDLVDILTAAHGSGCRSATIVAMLLGGRLVRVGRRTSPSLSFNDILVDAAEIRSVQQKDPPGALTQYQAGKALGLETYAMRALRAANVLEAKPSLASGRPLGVFTQADLQRFRTEYVKLSDLARELGMPCPETKKRLDAGGVSPAFAYSDVRVYIYRRDAVQVIQTQPRPFKARK